MRTLWTVRLLALVVSCWFISLPAAADPIALPLGEWVNFQWQGLGPIDFPEEDGFTLTSTAPARLRVTDGYVTGDAFDLLINDGIAASSPSVVSGIYTDIGTADAAWADARFSKLSWLLAAGQYDVDISVREACCPGGGAWIRADPIPEPATLTLVGLGIVAVIARESRRRRSRAVEPGQQQ